MLTDFGTVFVMCVRPGNCYVCAPGKLFHVEHCHTVARNKMFHVEHC